MKPSYETLTMGHVDRHLVLHFVEGPARGSRVSFAGERFVAGGHFAKRIETNVDGMEETRMHLKLSRLAAALWFVTSAGCLIALPAAADRDEPGKSERPAWTKTLTEAQRKEIEHQHHELDDAQAPYKKKEAEALAELNAMTIREDADVAKIHAKIDELMAAKTQIMRLRYEHLVDMRRVLTDEQKPGYDKGVLKRSAVR